jgi:hypothetical protein
MDIRTTEKRNLEKMKANLVKMCWIRDPEKNDPKGGMQIHG